MYTVAIVGGGLQGIFFAHSLIRDRLVQPDQLTIVDPNETLAAVWRDRTARIGMRRLRSSSSHNIDPDYRSLRRFARERGYPRDEHFLEPYARPSLDLFNDHLDATIRDDRLEESHVRARMTTIRREGERYEISATVNGDEVTPIRTGSVILALGAGEPARPEWSSQLGTIGKHLFDSAPGHPDPHAQAARDGKHIAVVGGGISAWQAALRYCRLGAGSVSLIAPHPIRESLWDSDPGYIGPKRGSEYAALDTDERLRRLKDVRYPGTLPPEIAREASDACDAGQVTLHVGTVLSARIESGRGVLGLDEGREVGPVDHVVFATGMTADIPYRELLLRISRELELPLEKSGHPSLDEHLAWDDGLYCAGRWGELVIGPQAANIVGAHLAFRRLHPALRRRLEPREVADTHSRSD